MISEKEKLFLDQFKKGLITEEELMVGLTGKSGKQLPDPQLLTIKELLEYVLNISSLLLGKKLPIRADEFKEYNREDLVKFLYRAKFPGRGIKGYLQDLDTLLDDSSSF